MSAAMSAAWAGMPTLPSILPVAPRPRRSTTRRHQPVSPLASSSSASARKASARPVRPWTSRAVFSASGSPQKTVFRSAGASFTGATPLFRLNLGFLEVAREHRPCGAHARFPGELLQGDAHLLVIAGSLGHAHVERLLAPGVYCEGARADASTLLSEPQLVVLVGPWPGQPPHL